MGLLIPEEVETQRLRLRRPTLKDAEAIFRRYASVPEVTRYLAWPTHRTVADTEDFILGSDKAWSEDGAGPYLVLSQDGVLLGGSGLALHTPQSAETGYVFAQDAWGRGYATEVVQRVVLLAFRIPSLSRLRALCHLENAASRRVLEKAGFVLEEVLRNHSVFPNCGLPNAVDVCSYARVPLPEGGNP
jgi:[ribosomal protein S5]-alanine N-acetyltransferase